MNMRQMILKFWDDIISQNQVKIREYFAENATIKWHNTNESFTTEEFIKANCEYPGEWRGEVEKLEVIDDLGISVTRVWLSDNSASFHVTSFINFSKDKIISIDEYWGEDGNPPEWRQNKKIGRKII